MEGALTRRIWEAGPGAAAACLTGWLCRPIRALCLIKLPGGSGLGWPALPVLPKVPCGQCMLATSALYH